MKWQLHILSENKNNSNLDFIDLGRPPKQSLRMGNAVEHIMIIVSDYL